MLNSMVSGPQHGNQRLDYLVCPLNATLRGRGYPYANQWNGEASDLALHREVKCVFKGLWYRKLLRPLSETRGDNGVQNNPDSSLFQSTCACCDSLANIEWSLCSQFAFDILTGCIPERAGGTGAEHGTLISSGDNGLNWLIDQFAHRYRDYRASKSNVVARRRNGVRHKSSHCGPFLRRRVSLPPDLPDLATIRRSREPFH